MQLKEDQIAPCGQEAYVVRTGDWRSMRPVIAPAFCQRCGQCWLFCPTGSISLGQREIQIDLNFCKGCGICAAECTFGAIHMERETGG